MALSGKVNSVAQKAPAAAPTAPAPAAAVGTPTAKGASKSETFRAAGQALRAKMDEKTKALEGSKSDKVSFQACIMDPSRPQKRREGKADVDSFMVVGYTFKLEEDMQVPVCPLKTGFKNLCDVEFPPKWEQHKAGDIVRLNNMETGIFISQTQFAGEFTGGGNTVRLSMKFSNERTDPLPVLNKIGEGSIKLSSEFVAEKSEVNGVTQYKVKEGFEKFAPLYIKRSAGGRGSAGTKTRNEAHRDLAQSFAAYISSKQ